MPLEEYRRKRRFSETPEPPPSIPKKKGRRFVVQKHRATRLHYDFRLEMEGVLKSWALPKGPTLDPGEKRLAMMTEDHPVSYFDFEGIIPPGNYGAGAVMVWDVGTWEPLPPPGIKDASAMLEKGDLKFRLRGHKLNGEFALVRIRSRRPGSRGNEWLLLKKRDDHVRPGYDPESEDRSVLSGRSLAQIAGPGDSRQWQSSRPASSSPAKKHPWLAAALEKSAAGTAGRKKPGSRKKPHPETQLAASPAKLREALAALPGAAPAPLPRDLSPMLATLAEKPFDSPDWLYEIKWDGYRALAYIQDGHLRLLSRNQNDLTAQFPELASLPRQVRAASALLDGEVVALDAEGRPSFSLMQQRTGMEGFAGGRRSAPRPGVPVVFYAFDLPWCEGYSLLRVPLEQRKQMLARILLPSDQVRYSEHFDAGLALFEAARARGLEGIIAKRRASLYEPKRSREWLKFKVTHRIECVVGGYTEPEGSRRHFGSLVLGLYDQQGRLIPVGQAGSGFTQATHARIWKRLQALKTAKSPFHGRPESPRRLHFVRPDLVAEIKFSEWTHEGQKGRASLRAPVFLGLRLDKPAAQCTFEEPVRPPPDS
jgi:bifunctional non-homologous end joining protein LigD